MSCNFYKCIFNDIERIYNWIDKAAEQLVFHGIACV
jgi:hypothetical protein